MVISKAVVHASHDPQRRADLNRLLERCPDAVVFVDTAYGMTLTSRLAWEGGMVMDADWHLVMEDDVLPCLDFERCLNETMEDAPEGLTFASLFGISKELRKAYENGERWVYTPRVNWAQALLVRRHWLESFLEWEANRTHDNPYWCQRLSDFAEHIGHGIGTAVPNLVQHVGHDRSLIGNPAKAGGRHARLSPVFKDDL